MLQSLVLYFAYGSNLDADNWTLWCERRGYEPASLEPLGPAWLPDHELAFHYESRLRGGGALNILPRHRTTIPGALFRVHDWEGLDAKEGVAGEYYRRVPVTALTSDGRAHAAITYRVCDRRVGDFVAPGPEYREMVIRGLSRFGHSSDGFLAAASGTPAPATPSAIFTYGTLMRGERSHDLLAPWVRRSLGTAQVTGASLVHIDWYPGLVLSDQGMVHGEVYELESIDTTLQELDAYEDFFGYERDDSLYRRSLVVAATSTGPRLAWTYVYLGDASAFPSISSGRWSAP